jgi:hypothetical protein
VALAVAVCAPAATNACCADAPVAVPPSSNTHVIAPGVSCGSDSVAVALNVIACPWPAVADAAEAVTLGAARWYSKAPMSRRAVPSPSPSTRRAWSARSNGLSVLRRPPGTPRSTRNESKAGRMSPRTSMSFGSNPLRLRLCGPGLIVAWGGFAATFVKSNAELSMLIDAVPIGGPAVPWRSVV